MANDEGEQSNSGESLDGTIALIRTASDQPTLSGAIARGVALTGYPATDFSRSIPLAEELTPQQRRLMEAIASRSGLTLDTVRTCRLPDPVQVRRRWLGLAPPGVLEKVVLPPIGPDGAAGPMPLWRALERRDLLARDDKPAPRLIDDPFERLRLAVELHEGQIAPYEVIANDGVLAERAPQLPADSEAIRWVRATFERLVLAWLEDAPGGQKKVRRLGPPVPGFLDHEVTGATQWGYVLSLLLATLARADASFVMPRFFDDRIPLHEPHALDLLGAVPEQRRDGVLVHAFRAARWNAIENALRVLPRFPSKALAAAVAERLEAASYRAEVGLATLSKQQRAWAALGAQLPSGVARPLARPSLVAAFEPRPPEPVPAVTPDELGDLPRDELTRRALADVSVFSMLAASERLAVAAEVAARLGAEFRPITTLVGARQLAAIEHVPSAYELVLLPGETIVVGLGQADLARLEQAFAGTDDLRHVAPFLERWFPARAVAQTIVTGPVAFGRDLVTGAAMAHFEGLAGDIDRADPASAISFPARCGFSLPSEIEWEQAARDAEGATFLYDAADVWFGGRPSPDETRAGLRDLDKGEWALASPDRAAPPAPWKKASGESPETADDAVFRGVFQARKPGDAGDVLTALVALRSASRPLDGWNQQEAYLRFVLRPTAVGHWERRG